MIPTSFRGALAAALLLGALAAPASAADLRVTGRVVDGEDQRPIAGATVELANAGGGQGFFRARTDARGTFALERVPAERWYALTVSADGYADFVLGSWQFPSAQRGADVVVPLDRAGVIEVRLTGSDGKTPVANAKVEVRPERAAEWWEGFRPPPAPVFTDAAGVARFPGLARGSWTVAAEPDGLLPFEARRVAVRRGETTPVAAKVARPGFLEGAIRLADGTPVAGVTVTARGPAEAVGTSGADGAFTVGGLPPGRYRIEVAHEGFEPAARKELAALREGQTVPGLDLVVVPRPAELSFVLEREAFGLDEPVQVGVRSFRVDAVDYALWEIPTGRLLDASRDFRALATGPDTAGLVRIASWSRATAEGAPWAWREEMLPIQGTLLPGAYVLAGRSGTLERRAVFFVTDLSLLVKRGREVLVSAASLKTGRPVAGAKVFLLRSGEPAPAGPGRDWGAAVARTRANLVVPGETDANGLWRSAHEGLAGPDSRIVGISGSNGIAVADAPVVPGAVPSGDRVFAYTDRPVYRPGQAVHWKAFARLAAGAGYALPDSGAVRLTLAGPQGATLDVPPGRLSARGSADGSIVLPDDVALGDWSLGVTAGPVTGAATFAVQEYRKPEFSVEVAPDREVYVNGDEVRFRVAATYFFGAPVFGATVRYNLFESRLGGEPTDEEGEPAGFGRVLKSGEARTDADGRVAIAFTPARAAYDRRLTLEVEVVDAAQRRVAARGGAIMGRGTFALAVAPLRQVVTAGEEIGIAVTARDHAGRPVRASVRVTLDQEAWNPLERRYARPTRPLAEAQVTTDERGRAFVALRPALARAGRLEIRVRAEDPRGNAITADGAVWVWDPKVTRYAYRYPSLEAYADRDSYAAGDTIRVLVNTDVADATVLASLEGRELWQAQVLSLRGNTGMARFVVRPEHAPNVFVALHVRKGREVRSRVLELPIAAARHDLGLALAFDRPEYRPGDSAIVAVRTTDAAGAPVAAEVSVGVVDEAIYSIRPDLTPDPHDVFYGRQPNRVTTVVSFPTLYYGGADKGGREGVRRDFRDVALWAPTVLTDSSGRGAVSLRWPDNLTTWRATSRGMTLSPPGPGRRPARALVGHAVAKTTVTKPLVARLEVPRALVAGDEATLVSAVDNRTAAPITGVEQSLAVREGPVRLAGPASRRADLPANGEARAEWALVARPPDAGADSVPAAVLELRARSRSEGDALEQRVPVLPRAVPLALSGAGVLAGAEAAVAVALPRDLVRPGSELALELSPSPAAMALRAAEWLQTFPYGCTEQSANAIRPAATALLLGRRLGIAIPGLENPAKGLGPALARLLAQQQPEGGWGWWREDDADPYLTALALDALSRARAAGLGGEPAAQALARGRAAMPRLIAQVRTPDGEAYVLAHLAWLLARGAAAAPGAPALEKAAPDDLRARLEDLALAVSSARANLSDPGLALAALGHLGLGRTAEAKVLVEALLARAQRDGSGVHWRGAAEDPWLGDDVEATGHALSAVLAVSPGEPRAAEALRWLAARRQGEHWLSTRATAPAAIALLDWIATHPTEARPDERVRVEWNGRPVLDRAFAPADAWGRGARVRVGGDRLAPGAANRLVIRREGAGVVYWSWRARAMVPSPGPAGDPSFTLRREYLHAERTADRRGRPRWLATAADPKEGFRAGEAVLVRLTLRVTAALDHVVLEDPRPAGFEVDELVPEGTDHPWNLHAEARDTRSVFFLERADEGDTVIEYLVRPEVAGRVAALPATASGMYDPARLARSGEEVVTVAGR